MGPFHSSSSPPSSFTIRMKGWIRRRFAPPEAAPVVAPPAAALKPAPPGAAPAWPLFAAWEYGGAPRNPILFWPLAPLAAPPEAAPPSRAPHAPARRRKQHQARCSYGRGRRSTHSPSHTTCSSRPKPTAMRLMRSMGCMPGHDRRSHPAHAVDGNGRELSDRGSPRA